MDRATLAQMIAAQQYRYQNDMPRPAMPPGMPPEAMLPPGFQMQPDAPGPQGPPGPVWAPQTEPDPRRRPIPNYYRLNPAPQNNWRDIVT